MNETKDMQLLVRELLAATSAHKNSRLIRLEPLAGDMSTRRYVRVHLEGKISSLILMILNQGKGPVRGGRQDLSQDDTFVELGSYLESIGVRTPKIVLDARKTGALLVEDIGDLGLWRFALNDLRKEDDKTTERVSLAGDPVLVLFKQAVDIIAKLQSAFVSTKSVAHDRWAEQEWYRQTIREFTEFYAQPKGLKSAALEVLYRAFDAICESIAAQPKTLAHFDYMAFNLFVLPSGELCVLDYQDMSLNSPVRDIISLVNDRDMDMALGQSRHAALLKYFVDKVQPGPLFAQWYDEYLLHWDFRVSGRFLQLADKRGIERYRQWVPGTLRRLGRTMLRAYPRMHGFDDVLEILMRLSPEIEEGTKDPWPLPM